MEIVIVLVEIFYKILSFLFIFFDNEKRKGKIRIGEFVFL